MTTEQQPIASAWDAYQQHVLIGAAQATRDECRMAFFAGAATLMATLHRLGNDEGEALLERVLDDMEAELAKFGQSLDAEWMRRMPVAGRPS
jgi:hypothetical protein